MVKVLEFLSRTPRIVQANIALLCSLMRGTWQLTLKCQLKSYYWLAHGFNVTSLSMLLFSDADTMHF